jgi:hypothetical protein
MILDSTVVSRDLAASMLAAGGPRIAFMFWAPAPYSGDPPTEWNLHMCRVRLSVPASGDYWYPAFTVTELLEMLPLGTILSSAEPSARPGGYYAFHMSWKEGAATSRVYYPTAADALADLWLQLQAVAKMPMS